jgi:hypothetical protein
VAALGKDLAALAPARAWLTVTLWAPLIAIAVITTALYGQHAL